MNHQTSTGPALGRRQVLAAGALAAIGATGSPAAAENSGPMKVGFISPNTGALATFGVSNQYIHDLLAPRLAAGLETRHLGRRAMQVDLHDAASSPAQAARIAQALVAQGYHMLVASGTPEICNPVADVCEAAGVPCVTTVAPWQAWLFGRNGRPEQGFDWTFHFFVGIEDFTDIYSSLFQRAALERVVGGVFGDDIDATAFLTAFPQAMTRHGLTLMDPGRLHLAEPDYRTLVTHLKEARVSMVAGVLTSPSALAFFDAARQVGWRPRLAAIAKAFAFPDTVAQAMAMHPDMAICNEVWWSPAWPFRSELTGATASEICRDYEAKTHRPWIQTLGFSHALLELAAQVLRDTPALTRQSLRDTLLHMRAKTVVGVLDFKSRHPSRNVCTTPAVGGQWIQDATGHWVLQVVDNTRSPFIPVTAAFSLPKV
jgi:branched-chain amino acid transport system substrate-binding protein